MAKEINRFLLGKPTKGGSYIKVTFQEEVYSISVSLDLYVITGLEGRQIKQ